MRGSLVRIAGLVCVAACGLFILWLYGQQPRTISEVTGGLQAEIGAYRVDEAALDEALGYFRSDRFPEARITFERADPARRDPTIQFYIAYSYYREGWGRLYHDDELYQAGLEAVDRSARLSGTGIVEVSDPNLMMHTGAELRAELERGIVKDADDLNPLKVFRTRK